MTLKDVKLSSEKHIAIYDSNLSPVQSIPGGGCISKYDAKLVELFDQTTIAKIIGIDNSLWNHLETATPFLCDFFVKQTKHALIDDEDFTKTSVTLQFNVASSVVTYKEAMDKVMSFKGTVDDNEILRLAHKINTLFYSFLKSDMGMDQYAQNVILWNDQPEAVKAKVATSRSPFIDAHFAPFKQNAYIVNYDGEVIDTPDNRLRYTM